MYLKNKLHIFFVFFLGAGSCFSQTDALNVFLSNDLNTLIDNYYIKYPSTRFHSAFRPYLGFSVQEANDSTFHLRNYRIKNHFLYNDVRLEPQYRNRFAAQFLPQVDMQGGFDALQNKAVSETSGGMYSRLDINTDFTADFTVIGGQVSYPGFTDTVISRYKVIPGLGMAYGANNKYTFANFTGHLSYSPIRVLNFQLGKDKMFIGDGYRSLLLSDVANSYPYFRSTVNIWKLQYSVWYSAFKDISNANGVLSRGLNKYGTFHYLSLNITPDFNIGYFETEIWQGTDTNRYRGYDPNYLNPIIFFRPIEYSLGSGDNALMGLNTSCKFLQRYKFYAQVVIDEFNLAAMKVAPGWWGNKHGWQFGLKCLDLFGIKNLSLLVEYNAVRPYTYSHGSPQQNYAHLNQPLAHPFGANFQEGIGALTYRNGRWQIDAKGVYAVMGKDTAGSRYSVGQNIYLSYDLRTLDYGNKIAQGIKYTFLQGELKFTYFALRGLNLRLEAGVIQRYVSGERGYLQETPFVYLGLKTSMYNFYRDY